MLQNRALELGAGGGEGFNLIIVWFGVFVLRMLISTRQIPIAESTRVEYVPLFLFNSGSSDALDVTGGPLAD